MAINKTINKSTKSHGAMRNCIEYVTRVDKTRGELVEIIGPYEPTVLPMTEYTSPFWKKNEFGARILAGCMPITSFHGMRMSRLHRSRRWSLEKNLRNSGLTDFKVW